MKNSRLDIKLEVQNNFITEHRSQYNHLGNLSIREKLKEGIVFLQDLLEEYKHE